MGAAAADVMILVLAIIFGLALGLLRAQWGGRRLAPPRLRYEWLVLVAFAPQLFAFFLPVTRELLADHFVVVSLVTSQVLLLGFVLLNLRQPGFWVLGLGLTLNMLVIAFNGGLMPISPETVARLTPDLSPDAFQVGQRLGTGKDIVLPTTSTRFSRSVHCLIFCRLRPRGCGGCRIVFYFRPGFPIRNALPLVLAMCLSLPAPSGYCGR